MKVFNNVTDIVRDDMASTMKKSSRMLQILLSRIYHLHTMRIHRNLFIL